MENVIVSEEKKKPVYDEQTLAKLLEAAYVLQEHGQELRALEAQLGLTRSGIKDSEDNAPGKAGSPKGHNAGQASAQESAAAAAMDSVSAGDVDPHPILEEIAELQHQIEARHLGLNDALALIAKEVIEICGAAGCAIGMSSSDQISYRAVAGIGAPPLSSSVAQEKACCFPCLRTGEVFRCPDVKAEMLIDAGECTRRGIASFIATPVFGNKGIAGGMELYFADAHAFGEQDVQTCQLMAGIITEILSRDSKSLGSSAEMSALLEHLSRLEGGKTLQSVSSVRCSKCGHELVGEEQFCGECGAARSPEPVSLESNIASPWPMEQATAEATKRGADSSAQALDASSWAAEVPSKVLAPPQSPAIPPETVGDSGSASPMAVSRQFQEQPAELSATGDSLQTGDWSSAVSAKEYLEQIAENAPRGWLAKVWNEHRGDVYLAIAIFLVVAVLRWGLGSSRPVNVNARAGNTSAVTHKAPSPDVSLFDQILIQMGLAEPPATPEDKGNPAAAVWVDLQTGLYYCPGADLYGKTPKGKYTAQRDAQLDQFAPAYRKVCD